MTQQIIDVGDAIGDGTGDPVRTAFTKSNDNFTELYARGGGTVTAPQGRLTLQTATPVMTTTQSAKTTIYYALYVGNLVPIYDGSTMTMTAFTELSNVTTASSTGKAGPAAVAASSVYDLFVWSDAGTVRLTRGPLWTNDTTRSAGTALTRVNGIWLNNAAITNGPAASRGTYVGTVRSNGSSQIDWIYGGANTTTGVAGFFGVWNCYNRVNVSSQSQMDAGSWNVGSSFGTWFMPNVDSGTGMRASAVFGLAEDSVRAQYDVSAGVGGAFSVFATIGFDSTTAFVGRVAAANAFGPLSASHNNTALGFHFWSALEGSGGFSSTFYGSATGNNGTAVFSWQARM